MPPPPYDLDDASFAAIAAAEGSLWRFSLSLYARPGVAEALIALQDRHDCDVNIALFALWSGAVPGHQLSPEDLAAAKAVIAGLNTEIIEPLRRLRRNLKDVADADVQVLRQRILRLELAAERTAQRRLATMLLSHQRSASTGDRQAAALSNLATCLGAGLASLSEADRIRAALSDLMRS